MTPKRVLILGRPGAGKGTQALRVSEMLGVAPISTGALLRDAIGRDGPVGRRCDAYVRAGHLVPMLLIGNIVRDVLVEDGAMDDGFVLDGFPRTCGQLQILDQLLGPHELDAALELEVSPDVVLQRLATRGREDDEPDIVSLRLAEYEEDTRPMICVLDARGLLISIDGSGDEDEVTADLFASLASISVGVAAHRVAGPASSR